MDDFKKDIGLLNAINYQKKFRESSFDKGIIPTNKFKVMGAKKAFEYDNFFEVVSYEDDSIKFVSNLYDYKGIILDFYSVDGVDFMTTTNPHNNNNHTVKCHKTPLSTLHRAAMNKIKSIKGE